MYKLACSIAQACVIGFSHPFMVAMLCCGSFWTLVWSLIARSDTAFTLFLSVLALAITSAILYVGESREELSAARDKAMHAKLDELIRDLPDVDSSVAGIEPEA